MNGCRLCTIYNIYVYYIREAAPPPGQDIARFAIARSIAYIHIWVTPIIRWAISHQGSSPGSKEGYCGDGNGEILEFPFLNSHLLPLSIDIHKDNKLGQSMKYPSNGILKGELLLDKQPGLLLEDFDRLLFFLIKCKMPCVQRIARKWPGETGEVWKRSIER